MKRRVGNILIVICLFVLVSLLASCNDLLDYGKGVGRNILHFSINGDYVDQVERGSPRLHNFRTENGLFFSYPLSYAAFKSDDNGYTTIRAILDSPLYYELRMKMPAKEIAEGATCHPEVSLYYVLLPQIRAIDYITESGYTRYKTIRKAVYSKAIISEASLKVSSYYPANDPRKGKPRAPTLCGDFSFSGHYTDSLGNVVSFRAIDGYFDVSDSPVIFGEAPENNGWAEFDDVVLED